MFSEGPGLVSDLVWSQRQWAAESADPEFRAMLALSLSHLAWLSFKKDDLPDAEAHAREAVAAYEALAAEHAGQLVVRYGRHDLWTTAGDSD